jgi:hypothetical protein
MFGKELFYALSIESAIVEFSERQFSFGIVVEFPTLPAFLDLPFESLYPP